MDNITKWLITGVIILFIFSMYLIGYNFGYMFGFYEGHLASIHYDEMMNLTGR